MIASRKTSALLAAAVLLLPGVRSARADQQLYPRHMNAKAEAAIKKGLDALAALQGPDGNFPGTPDGSQYGCVMASLAGMAFLANGNTPSRGPYAENIRRAVSFVMSQGPGPTG